MHPRKLGLVLGGGGAKGSAHLGVLQEIERLGMEFDLVCGTSIGALVGAIMAAGQRTAAIERAFRETTLRRILALDPARWGLIGSDRLAAVLTDLLGERTIEDLPLPYAAVAVDLVTGHEVVLERGSLVEAALASAAVPGVFPPRRNGDYILADGGIRNNLPIDVARRMGAERVVAVNLIGEFAEFSIADPRHARLFSLRRWAPITQLVLAERAIALMVEQLTAHRLRETPPDLLITPDVSTISMANLNLLDDGIAAGAAAVRPYRDELDALRRWRLGEDLALKPGRIG
ncbi:MAG TPA: patatin-like phospholipase family protein [Herpetosiphonaceae bacterium]|nr:patatin-like phospholipase family protein [Herpetosiphonaceae bacterium]